MTDKEIIIDGVDVAGCEHILADKFCAYDIWKAIECSKFHNCTYKQLKRLEAENERLKEKIIKLSEEKGHLIVRNNTLKEANQSLSMLSSDLAYANETVRKEFFRADKNKDMWREKAEKYEQCLRKIKAIAEEINNDIKILYNRKLHNGLRKILQLIESEEE